MRIGINGAIVDQAEAVVSVYDHGFLYGMGLFETFRTYRGKPFLLKEHMQRLGEGCRELGIEFNPELKRIEEQIQDLLEANQLLDAYVRFTVSAGSGLLGLPLDTYADPNVIVYVKPLPQTGEDVYEAGIPLQLLNIRRNTPEGSVRLKSLHYMNNILAKRELQGYPWASGAEGLMLDQEGCLAEGIVSNLFFIRNGRCMTPAVDTGILPGITRKFVLPLAEQIGLETVEGRFLWKELSDAEEVFLTNSIREVVPVNRLYEIDGSFRQVGGGQVGDWTRKLIGLYRQATMDTG